MGRCGDDAGRDEGGDEAELWVDGVGVRVALVEEQPLVGPPEKSIKPTKDKSSHHS